MSIELEEYTPNEHTFYCTFGFGQPNQGGYIKVRASDEMAAREFMFAHFGRKWSMIYPSAEAAGVEEWGLKEIK